MSAMVVPPENLLIVKPAKGAPDPSILSEHRHVHAIAEFATSVGPIRASSIREFTVIRICVLPTAAEKI